MKQLLASFCFLVAATTTAHAGDVISDDQCQAWEHWEGGHSGRCACACTIVGAPASDAWPAAAALGFVGIVAIRRRR